MASVLASPDFQRSPEMFGLALALMVLPTLMVGNELLILGSVGLAVGAWFLAHRHGQLRGMVAASNGSQTPGSVKCET